LVWEDRDLVFSTRTGGVLRPSTVTEDAFKPLLERDALPRSTRFHDLRHTCATLLLSRAVDVVSVQRLLGHASAAMTLSTDAHYVPGPGEATAQAMEGALS
jgi:integrase